MKELVAEKSTLTEKLAKLEVILMRIFWDIYIDYQKNEPAEIPAEKSESETAEEKRKRFRRMATEIDRHYRCLAEGCQKSYGYMVNYNDDLVIRLYVGPKGR